MDTHVGKLIDSVGSIFRGSDVLPWCDPDIIAVSLSFPPPFLCEITAASAAGCLPGRPVDECRQSDRFLLPPSCRSGGMRTRGPRIGTGFAESLLRWELCRRFLVVTGNSLAHLAGRLNQQWITSHSTVALLRSLSKTNQLSDCIPLSGQAVFDHAHARLIVIVATRSL